MTGSLADWFDGFVGDDEERAVAESLIAVVAAAQAAADLSRPDWPQEFWYGVREREMRHLRAALADLREATSE